VIAGIILAAGASRRMGAPKALLEFHGETFLDRLIRLMERVADPVIVVLGHHAEAIQRKEKAQKGKAKAQFVVNPDPERGQLSSLQTALAALPPEATGFLFMPVDCPAVKQSTLQKLALQFRDRDPATLLVVPRCGDRRGHPVCAAQSLAAEFLALPPTAEARDVVHRHVAQTRYVDVDDPGILSDIDDPESYRKLTESDG
jgi:CTP:molybdopterin cytidylyltransferase MocA